MRNAKLDRWSCILAVLTLAIAWWIGREREQSALDPHLQALTPAAFTGVGESCGYGGPLKVAVSVGADSLVVDVRLVSQSETAAFFERVTRAGGVAAFRGHSIVDIARGKGPVLAVTGASLSANALRDAMAGAGRGVCAGAFDLLIPEPHAGVAFGWREILLVVFFAIGFLGFARFGRLRRPLRWLTLLASMLWIGFIFTIPLTLGRVLTLLLGYWPNWHGHLYWYILMGGIFLPLFVRGATPYCETICPFGAVQDCLGSLGRAKPRMTHRLMQHFKWVSRLLALALLCWGLLTRDPGITTYEVFGATFRLVGTKLQFVLAALVLATSLFITRFWCRLLCPLHAVIDGLRTLRGIVVDAISAVWKVGSGRE